MISLKEARQKAINIIGQDKVPAYSTLRDWTSKGFISGVIEGTSRGAKYPDHIVYEIITAIKLKNEHNIKLTKIAEVRSDIDFTSKDYYSVENYINKLSNYVEKLNKEQEKLSNHVISSNKDLIIDLLEKKLSKIREINKKIELLKVYIKYIAEYS